MTRGRDAVRTVYQSQGIGQEAAPEIVAGKELNVRQDEGIMTSAQSLTPLPPPLVGKKLITATMLAVFIAELAPTALQWVTGACFPRRVLEDRALLGAVTQLPGLAHEPVNEMGVILLFGMVARAAGFYCGVSPGRLS